MQILVTGAAGFIGSNLCNYFDNIEMDYIGVDNLSFGYEDNLTNKSNLWKIGFEKIDEKTLKGVDVLVHLACSNIIYAQDHQVETFRNNALNTFYLFKNFKGKIVYTSTSSVYGQADTFPTDEDSDIRLSNAYDQSKYLSELYLQLRGNFTTLRLSNVYGKNQRPNHPYSGAVGKFIDCATNKKPFQINGDGMATRDYTHISDVVGAILSAIEKPAINEAVNIGTGVETTSLKLAYLVSQEFGVPFNVNFVENRSIDSIQRRKMDIRKAERLLGWKPKVNVSKGIRFTADEYQSIKAW